MLKSIQVSNDHNYLRFITIKQIFTIGENNNFSLDIMWLTIRNFDLYLDCLDWKEIKSNQLEYLLINSLICLFISCKLDGKTFPLNQINLYGNFNLTLEELKDKEIQLLNTIRWQLIFWSPFYNIHQIIDQDSISNLDYKLTILSQKILQNFNNLKLTNDEIISIFNYCLQPSKKKLQSMTTNLQKNIIILLNDEKKDLTNFFKSTKNKKLEPMSTPIKKSKHISFQITETKIISSPIKKIEHQLNKYKNKEDQSLLCSETI